MTHEYKVGDKIRMLESYLGLGVGEVFTVEGVDNDYPNQPVKVGLYRSEFYWPFARRFELVTEEETAPEQDNTDLLENRIPFGLLEPDVQKRMEAWEHGHEYWNPPEEGWELVPKGDCLYETLVYRAKPAPVEPERVTRWANVYSGWFYGSFDSRDDCDGGRANDRIALWRITYDKETGLNPVIEVEQDVLRPQEDV